MNRETLSQSAQEKARYASATLRRIGRLRKRRFEAESDLINLIAVHGHANQSALRAMVVEIDEKFVDAETNLNGLRKTSALDWHQMRDRMDSSVSQLKRLVDDLESRTISAETDRER